MKGVAHMSETMTNKLIELCGKDIRTASNAELYHALLKLVDEKSLCATLPFICKWREFAYVDSVCYRLY